MALSKFFLKFAKFLLIAVLIFLSGFPVYWMFVTFLSTEDQLYNSNGQPWWPQLGNLVHAFSGFKEIPIIQWFGNTLVIAIGTTIIGLVLGVVAGYAMSRYRFYGKGLISLLLFMTQVLPEVLLLVPLYTVFITLGLLNSLFGLVLANVSFSLPITIFIIKGAIDSIPHEIEESAMIDGCRSLDIVSMIVIPLISPSIAAAAVVSFFSGWNEYLFASTFLNNKNLWPVSVGLASFIGQYDTPMASVMGASLLFSIPAIFFFILVQRKIVSGLIAGAVKG